MVINNISPYVYRKASLLFTVDYTMFVTKVTQRGVFGIGDSIAGNMTLIDKENITNLLGLVLIHGRIPTGCTYQQVKDNDCAVYGADTFRVCVRLSIISYAETLTQPEILRAVLHGLAVPCHVNVFLFLHCLLCLTFGMTTLDLERSPFLACY